MPKIQMAPDVTWNFLLVAALLLQAVVIFPSFTAADDTFTCCMAGWKSVRGVVLCPRPCCEGYYVRKAVLPGMGSVTYCHKRDSFAGITNVEPAGPRMAPATNLLDNTFPLSMPVINMDEQEKSRNRFKEPTAQQRLRRVRPAEEEEQNSGKFNEKHATNDLSSPILIGIQEKPIYSNLLTQPNQQIPQCSCVNQKTN